jgi:hypothetical protein
MGEPNLLSDKVCIVGGAAGRDDAQKYQNTDWNIWCVARIYNHVPYATLVFDMHQNAQNRTKNTTDAHVDRKLIMQAPCSDYPNAYILPVQELMKEFSLLTSSFSWIIAYAIHRGASEIALCGVNMSHISEFELQRPGLFYSLGDARARGVQITTAQTSQLRANTDIDFSHVQSQSLSNEGAKMTTKKVVIIGAGAGYEMIRDYEKNPEYEIWCVPTIYPVLVSHRIDRVFEVHPVEKWKAGVGYVDLGPKLMLSKPEPQAAPNATTFPVEALQTKYGVVFSSSIAWMVGYALAAGVKEIVFLGVDMADGYSGQRDGLFFLLGFAKASKINIVIPETSKLNIFGKSYGWV